MIIDVRKADAVLPEPSAADATLPPLEFFFESGNSCVVAPAMRKDPEKPGACFIAVTYSWQQEPNKADEKEIVNWVNRSFKQPPMLEHVTEDLQEALRLRDEFLNPAKRH